MGTCSRGAREGACCRNEGVVAEIVEHVDYSSVSTFSVAFTAMSDGR